jgi:hypothetical protein
LLTARGEGHCPAVLSRREKVLRNFSTLGATTTAQ